jgi:hypothetical protein
VQTRDLTGAVRAESFLLVDARGNVDLVVRDAEARLCHFSGEFRPRDVVATAFVRDAVGVTVATARAR